MKWRIKSGEFVNYDILHSIFYLIPFGYCEAVVGAVESR